VNHHDCSRHADQGWPDICGGGHNSSGREFSKIDLGCPQEETWKGYILGRRGMLDARPREEAGFEEKDRKKKKLRINVSRVLCAQTTTCFPKDIWPKIKQGINEE
jgi:hypothetical protein